MIMGFTENEMSNERSNPREREECMHPYRGVHIEDSTQCCDFDAKLILGLQEGPTCFVNLFVVIPWIRMVLYTFPKVNILRCIWREMIILQYLKVFSPTSNLRMKLLFRGTKLGPCWSTQGTPIALRSSLLLCFMLTLWLGHPSKWRYANIGWL